MGIPLVTMRLNSPVLPLPLAAACTATTMVGLLLALIPGRMAAHQPGELGWLAMAGLGLAPSLLLLRAVELAGKGQVSGLMVYGIAVGSTLIGGLWTCGIAYLHAIHSRTMWKTWHLATSALIWSYLLAPLAHYLLLTPPGYRYISAASNFFASTPTAQALCFLVLAFEANAADRLHQSIRRRTDAGPVMRHVGGEVEK